MPRTGCGLLLIVAIILIFGLGALAGRRRRCQHGRVMHCSIARRLPASA